MIGTIPKTARPCRCESPHLDRLGTIYLDNTGTYRVRYCQVCGGAYDSTRDAEPLPPEATVGLWECRRCGAPNIRGGVTGCSNCPPAEDDWRCRDCGLLNPVTLTACQQCDERRPGRLIVAPRG
jgi:ribosomal protein L40E